MKSVFWLTGLLLLTLSRLRCRKDVVRFWAVHYEADIDPMAFC